MMKTEKIIITCTEETYDRFYYLRKLMRKKVREKLDNEQFINLLLDLIDDKLRVRSY